jgi:hypothetical protein
MGTFLGLYFTTVSLVASTSYRDVPDDVRKAAMNERIGESYLGVLSILTAAAVTQSGLLACDVNPGRLNFLALVVLSTFGVFTFVPLGMRAFVFLDPIRLSETLSRDILQAAAFAGSARHFRIERSFQDAYRRHAEKKLSTLENAVGVCLREQHRDSAALQGVAIHLLAVAHEYVQLKPTIPTGSLWFPRRPEFRSWLAPTSTHLQMALQTATAIPPDEVPHVLWIEQRLFALLKQITQALLDGLHYELASEVLNLGLGAIEALVLSHRFSEAQLLTQIWTGVTVPLHGEDSGWPPSNRSWMRRRLNYTRCTSRPTLRHSSRRSAGQVMPRAPSMGGIV